MRGWKGGRAALQYHLLDDGVAWGLRFNIFCSEVLRILPIVLAHIPPAGRENQFMLGEMFLFIIASNC